MAELWDRDSESFWTFIIASIFFTLGMLFRREKAFGKDLHPKEEEV